MGGCCSKQDPDSEASKLPPVDRTTQLPAGLSFHLPTTGPLSPQEFRQRIVCSAGTQEVQLPTSEYTLKYPYVSFRGYYPEALYKPSQDTACAIRSFAGDPEQIFFGVFDGHGTSGTECSQFAKDQVCLECLAEHARTAHLVVLATVCHIKTQFLAVTCECCPGAGSNAEGYAVQVLSRKIFPQCNGSRES